MVHEGNKDEADKCFKLAQIHFQDGNRDKALKFAIKAQKLFPSESCNDFVDLLNRLNSTPHSQSNGSPPGATGNNSSRRNSNENIRQRKPETEEEASKTSSQSSSVTQEYTSEQVAAVQRIKKCKDYYEILGITKEATDSDLKKMYRKLALQFHPDKNKAPGADEAFKAVGNAFAVLSEPEKRKQYDLYGPDESNSNIHRSHTQQDYTRGYEGHGSGSLIAVVTGLVTHFSKILFLLLVLTLLTFCFFLLFDALIRKGKAFDPRVLFSFASRGKGDVTAEELFNMFFGGGYPGGGVYVRRNGRWERSRPERNRTTTHHHHHGESQGDQSSLSVFLQLMPLLLILLLSLASSFLSSDSVYSLSRTSKYPVMRTTHNLGINFYVKPDFGAEYQGAYVA